MHICIQTKYTYTSHVFVNIGWNPKLADKAARLEYVEGDEDFDDADDEEEKENDDEAVLRLW
jgi:hypothetical protein